MAQNPPGPTAGLAVVDEQRVSRGPCQSSSQNADTTSIVGDGALRSSQQEPQQQEMEQEPQQEEMEQEPQQQEKEKEQEQEQEQEQEEEEEEKEEAPVSAAAAPVIAPASGPAVDTGPGQSLSIDRTSLQQQQQHQKQRQQQEAPDLCVPHARSELTPAKRPAPPSMAVGSNGGGGNGRGVASIGRTGGGGTAGKGDSSLRCFNKLASMIPGPPGDSSFRCFNKLAAMIPGPPLLRPAAVHDDSSRSNNSDGGDLQRSASPRLVVSRDTAAAAAAAAAGAAGAAAPGPRMGVYEQRAAPSTSSTNSIITQTGGRSRRDDVRVGAAAPPPPPTTAVATESTAATAATAGVSSHVPHPGAAAGAEDQRLSGNDRRRGMRDGVGGMPHPPELSPAAHVAGWSHPGMPGALSTSSIGGGLRPIAPAPPFYAAHRWPPPLQVSQGVGIAPNAGGAGFGWPQGYVPYVGGWGGGMINYVGGGPVGNAAATPCGARGIEAEEEEEEDDEEEPAAPLVPADVPPGRDLNSTPWCCGSGKCVVGKGGEPALLCDTPGCKRWMCHPCRTDKRRGGGCSTFVCCECALTSGACWCCRCKLTVYRRIQKANQTRAGYVRRTRVEQAYNRKTTATVFKFPVTTTSLSESATGGVEQQFSVSLTYRESRLTVTVKTKPNDPETCAVFCSGRECQPVSAQATDVVSGNEQTAADRCEHATLVLGDGAVPKSDIPEVEALTFGEGGEGVEALIEKAQTRGCLGQLAASTISEMAQAAAEDGFPLAVRLGDTQIFAVYNAKNQYVPGAWAYVRTTNVAPAGGTERSASQGRKGISTTPRFMCKAYRGRPCGTARREGTKCPHTHIVALGMMGNSAYGSTAPANPGDDNGGGVDSGDAGVVGTGTWAWKHQKPLFMAKVKRLLKILGAVKFPVNPIPHLSRDGKRGLLGEGSVLSCLEDVCAVCAGPYARLRNVSATALIPGPNFVEVVVSIKGCLKCGTEGATGDDWRETGFFVFGDKLAVHISHLVAIRRAVQSGTSIADAWQEILVPLADDWEWMETSSFANKALTNDYWMGKLLDVYLAYEALTDHPYAFSSVVHGFYPLTSSWDGRNEQEVRIKFENYIDQRDEHVIDMDRSAVWLALSMLSPMLFSRRLQFSYNTPVAFCPQNRKSNILKLPGRGPAPRGGDVEAGDGSALREYVEEQEGGLALRELLGRMTLEELTALYGKCFGSKLPGVDRYPTAVLLRELFERVWDYWQETHHGEGEDCARFFLERGLSLTSGVEGEFAIDGVQTCHMFLLRASSPAEVAELILHHKHLPILVNTDIMCRLGPLLHARCPSAAKDEGVLPRIGEANGGDMRAVDIPSLAALGSSSPDVEERGQGQGQGQGQQPVPEEKCTQENAYNVLRDAAPFPSVQQRLDFGQLLEISCRNDGKRDSATRFAHLARSCFRELRRKGHFSVSLFEVVVVLHTLIAALAALLQEDVDDGAGGSPRRTEREAGVDFAALLSNALAFSAFSASVLAAAIGSTTGEVPTLPAFCGELCQPRRGDAEIRAEATVLAYAEAKEEFIAAKLLPEDDKCKMRAVRAVRSGACFGAAVHRVKALQIQLAHGNPGESADEAGKVAGFGLSFNIAPPQDDRPGATTTRQPHPYSGDTDGPYYAPEDAAREAGHGVDCRQKYGGLASCAQLAGVKLNSHEQDDARKSRHASMLNALQFDRFAFTVTLVNEVENEGINRRSLEGMVGRFRGHPADRIKVCKAEIWFCGRCFCSKPLLRSFDQFGRVRLSFLPQ